MIMCDYSTQSILATAIVTLSRTGLCTSGSRAIDRLERSQCSTIDTYVNIDIDSETWDYRLSEHSGYTSNDR